MKKLTIKDKERIWNIIYETLRLNHDMICNECQKRTKNLFLLIDYQNKNLIHKSCVNCTHKLIYRGLTKKDLEFNENLMDIYNRLELFDSLKAMRPRERMNLINDELRILRSLYKDLKKEAVKRGLAEIIPKEE